MIAISCRVTSQRYQNGCSFTMTTVDISCRLTATSDGGDSPHGNCRASKWRHGWRDTHMYDWGVSQRGIPDGIGQDALWRHVPSESTKSNEMLWSVEDSTRLTEHHWLMYQMYQTIQMKCTETAEWTGNWMNFRSKESDSVTSSRATERYEICYH